MIAQDDGELLQQQDFSVLREQIRMLRSLLTLPEEPLTSTRGVRAVVPEITEVLPEKDSLKTGNINYVHAVPKVQPPFLTRELSEWLPDTGVPIVNDTGSPVPIKLSVEPGKWADFTLKK